MSQEKFNPLYAWAEKTRMEFAVPYNLEGIQKIEEAIMDSRSAFASLPEKERYARVHAFGAFVGQCLIVNFNGEWHNNGGSIGVKLADQGIWADPFEKVWKQFQNGNLSDSISAFYTVFRNLETAD